MKSKCACGDVELNIGKSEHTTINCHCNMCRKLHGSPFTTWVSFPKSSVIEEPSLFGKTTQYHVGENSISLFCKKCGTHVMAKDARYPEVVAFLAGTLEGIDINTVSGEYFYSDKVHWLGNLDSIKKFGGKSGFEQL